MLKKPRGFEDMTDEQFAAGILIAISDNKKEGGRMYQTFSRNDFPEEFDDQSFNEEIGDYKQVLDEVFGPQEEIPQSILLGD